MKWPSNGSDDRARERSRTKWTKAVATFDKRSLFVQGLQRVIAVDAFNGTILWGLEIPALERFNMPRDCSNWCADDEYVYIAAKDKCWQIDAATGDVVAFHPVVNPAGGLVIRLGIYRSGR